MAQENREAYIQWLREEINEYCNSDGNYEAFWDYDERIEPDSVMEAVTRYKEEGCESPSDYLEMRLYDAVGADTEDYFYGEILLRDLDRAPEEVRECWHESDSIWDDMQEAGYSGIDINLDDALRHSDFRVNVFFATEAEKSCDMTGIVRSFGSWHAPDPACIEPADLDNALSYLVNQQGHSVSELYPSILSEDAPEPDSPFIASVVEDIIENTGSDAMSELCALVSIDGRGMMEFMDRLSNPTDSIVLPKDYATIGVFNEWGGCGGTMDIQLEKDAVLPLSMVRGFQLEGQSGSYGNYTVDEAYGLVNSCWMPCSFSEGTPPDPREDYAAAIDKVREDSGHREPKAPERQQTPPRLGEISNEGRDSSSALGVEFEGVRSEVIISEQDTTGLTIDDQVFFSGLSHDELTELAGERDTGLDFAVLSVGEPFTELAEPVFPDVNGRSEADADPTLPHDQGGRAGGGGDER